MKYLIILIASLVFFACRTSKQTVTQKTKTVDSLTVKVTTNDVVAKRDSVVKKKATNKSFRASDSGYTKITNITEIYTDDDDGYLPIDSTSVSGAIKRPGRIMRRNITIHETGAVKRSENTRESNEQQTSVAKYDSTSATDSTARKIASNQTEIRATKSKTVFLFSWWWLILMIIAGGLYYLNKRFQIWQILKRLLRL